ncbi:hypothetical protein LTS12_017220 [Elasticomyces elasticus]|nr:hypothetical protein LTS12_017220 [Elasticomyces elasticus]
MYLINAKTYRLEYFMDSDIPPYAILSHTWGPGEEVTFQDMQDTKGTGLGKPGFSKIRFTCEQALADNLQYAWVDTCCIDKQSSAELSEAINSMFLWYHGSQVCYALLSDLVVSQLAFPDNATAVYGASFLNLDVLPKLGSCRWFTRGWSIDTTVLNWDSKSDHRKLAQRFYDRGDLCVLRAALDGHSIARRMSWAAHRQTSRVEDVAYSLMGIFGVNMPMLYGEGRRSFIRLGEEIARTSMDLSLFAWESRYTGKGRLAANTHGILADHPCRFCLRDGYDIVAGTHHWLLTHHESGYALGSEGLQLIVPVVKNFHGFAWAILDCSVDGDFTGPLALRLIRYPDFQHSPPKYVIHQTSELPRVAVIPVELVDEADTMAIMLLSPARLDAAPPYTPQDSRDSIDFRVNFFTDGRSRAVDLRETCTRTQGDGRAPRVWQSEREHVPLRAESVAQDITISIPGHVQFASGLCLMTTTMGPLGEPQYQLWNVAFHVWLGGLREQPWLSKPWVVIESAVAELRDLFASASAAREEVADCSEASLAVGGTMVRASIKRAVARIRYWQVDIEFSAATE